METPLMPKEHRQREMKSKRQVSLYTALSVQFILCSAKLGLSIWWKHWFGVGFSIGAMIFTAICIYAIWKYEVSAPVRGLLLVVDVIVVFFLSAFVVFVLIGQDFKVSQFPTGCRKTTNCCRLTTNITSNVQATNLTCPTFNTTVNSARDAVKSWIRTNNNAAILEDADSFVRARFVTFLWGFPDDFYVGFNCTTNSEVELWIQGEARIGTGDFGVNRKRVEQFLNEIGKQQFATGICS